MVKVLTAFLLTGMLGPGPSARAQTVISETGRLIFFNSLDSSQGANLTRLATVADCWLQTHDPRDSFPVLLDLRRDTAAADSASDTRADTASWTLGYDNLYGNSLQYPDSATAPTDPAQLPYYLRLGLRIRCCDSVPDPRSLLRLLDYGIIHYADLQQTRALSQQGIDRILAQSLSPRTRAAFRTCLTAPR